MKHIDNQTKTINPRGNGHICKKRTTDIFKINQNNKDVYHFEEYGDIEVHCFNYLNKV